MLVLNKAIIAGNLGQEPEYRVTQGGTSVTTLNIATTEKEGDRDVTEWHKVIVWGKAADHCHKYLCTGSAVYIEGKIKYRTFEKDGVKKFFTEIHANHVKFNGGKKKGLPQDVNQAMQDVKDMRNRDGADIPY